MKMMKSLFQKGNWIPFLMVLSFALGSLSVSAQAPTVFARCIFMKVGLGNEEAFLKTYKENFKPANKIRQQNGKITGWGLYRIHFTGSNDEYNYVTIHYYDSWEKTEGNDNWLELMKAANPKGDAAALLSKAGSLRSIVRESLYLSTDATSSDSAHPSKYFEIDYMKLKDGMASEYVKTEKEIWKPLHQVLVNDGKRSVWALWSLIMPGGSSRSHDYVTANGFPSYKQMAGDNYEEAFKKAHPGKDMQAEFDKTLKTRDLVRSEIWELVDSL